MEELALGLSALALGSPLVTANDASQQAEPMVTVHHVDFRGKPPFRRSRETLPLTDIAEVTTMDLAAQTRVSKVDFKGRPPFKRNKEKLDVVDIAKLETVNPEATTKRPQPRFASRNVGPRHRQ